MDMLVMLSNFLVVLHSATNWLLLCQSYSNRKREKLRALPKLGNISFLHELTAAQIRHCAPIQRNNNIEDVERTNKLTDDDEAPALTHSPLAPGLSPRLSLVLNKPARLLDGDYQHNLLVLIKRTNVEELMREIMTLDASQRLQSTSCTLPPPFPSQNLALVAAAPTGNEDHLEITTSAQTTVPDAVIQRSARKLVEVARLVSEQACVSDAITREQLRTFSRHRQTPWSF